ncbi:tetratricopeptide repeat protein [Segetibacter koreensis]|uniref:tetratricopeptide repeat protein n=1 Tax=Segetibacter koreensis TaxID=398037 RepID=UPI00036AF84F|nr:tetratricopeptide repeat protein [Segetibacter koreensis]
MGKIVFIIMLLPVTLIAKGQDDQSLVAKGNELYKKQQFEKAAEEYQKAADLNAKNAKAQYNLGDALYKSKKSEAAEKAFGEAAANTKDEVAKSKALYNRGVTLSNQKKLLESIEAYKESLLLNSTDQEARENLQKALNELKKQSQQNQQKQENKKQDKQQNQKQPEQQKNNSKLNEKQVEQMLSALRKDEKKLQQDLQKKNNTGRSNSKDW